MKLALIRRQFAATGGAELYTQRLCQALAESGHEVHLFAENWPASMPEGGKILVHPVPITRRRSLRPLHFALAVQMALTQQPFDCVFSLDRTLSQDVYRAGDGVHRVWLARRRQLAPLWKRWWMGRSTFHRNLLALERRVFDARYTGCIIVNSNMVKEEILAHFPYPADRIHLVRNGVDVARFQNGNRQAFRHQWGLPEAAIVFLFAGSGWERKGLRWVLEAFARIRQPNWFLVVAGKGRPPWPHPRRVIFTGPLADLEHAYAAADVFVFPAIYEPSANVVYEALAAGLPVITSRWNGACEIIEEDRTGTVLPRSDDVPALAAAMELWAKRNVRVVVDKARLSLENNVSQTLDILMQAAERQK